VAAASVQGDGLVGPVGRAIASESAQAFRGASTRLVSVLICTRNRPRDVARAARSLLASTAENLELLVIDQSDDDLTERQFTAPNVDRRVRYLRAPSTGKPVAMNLGLRLARSSIVVVTDDDCEASSEWVGDMARELACRPRVALVFSRVVAAPHDPRAGYIPTFEPTNDRLVRSMLATCVRRGLGAGMAMRKEAVLALGGCDETIGPGTRFLSGDDWDLELRLLSRGWLVYEAASLSIVHHGFRSFAEGVEHSRQNWYGMGAVVAKPLRAGHPSGAVLALWQVAVNVLLAQVKAVARGRRPFGLRRIPAFCRGFLAGLLTPVDRDHLTYRPRSA
jgi:GT2 family glycosyltransferase